MLTAGLRLVHSGELPLMTLLKAMSSAPAEILGLAGGTLRQGSPADVIVIDLDVPWVLDPAELKSKCKNTPFDEAQAAGPRGAHHRGRPHRVRIRLSAPARACDRSNAVKYRQIQNVVRSTRLGRDVDRSAALPIVAISATWVRFPKIADHLVADENPRNKKTRRGVPPGHVAYS